MGCGSCNRMIPKPVLVPPPRREELFMPLAASNPVSATQLSIDDMILNFIRDRVADRLVYNSLFDAASANWLTSQFITSTMILEKRQKNRFPKPKEGEHALDWLAENSDGVNMIVEELTGKFLKFQSSVNTTRTESQKQST